MSGHAEDGASALMGLFSPPPTVEQVVQSGKPTNDEKQRPDGGGGTEHTPLLEDFNSSSSSLQSVSSYDSPRGSDEATPKTGSTSRKSSPQDRREKLLSGKLPSMPTIQELSGPKKHSSKSQTTIKVPFFSMDRMKGWLKDFTEPPTWVGGFMFLLFQVVFSLTFGATITRPHGATSLLGLMTKMASLGIILGAPVYWLNLRDVPAIYPTVDLFAAPFLAVIAAIIDEELFNDPDVSEAENDQVFLATFTTLTSISLFTSGTLLYLASVFKLANLGLFLPFPVLCGFFAAVGVLTWTLAFKIDTNGLSVSAVFLSGDRDLILTSLAHHAPSVFVAAVMKYLGPKNPLYVVLLVLSTIALFYAFMFTFGIPMEQMIERHWFWSTSDLHYEPMDKPIGFAAWATPAPFGWINTALEGKIHWRALSKGLSTSMALSFLYLIRCSLHGAALKKNVPMLSRVEKVKAEPLPRLGLSRDVTARFKNNGNHRRLFSDAIDIESIESEPTNVSENDTVVVTAKPTHASLKQILLQYGYSQFVCGILGSFSVTPCVAASPTMFMLKAEKVAPQLVSVLLLIIFYLTNFKLVSCIPKPAFSCLLVLAFIDIISSWFIKSYFKTKEKVEWLVVPTIVLLAFVVGLLQAVFLGIALSTFLFVASFFRSGVVKFVANGINIRSTIERPPKVARWLDTAAAQIQILVLQNFLFFGNSSSILSYITTMFEEPEEDIDPMFLPPIPKVVILDLSLVTGIDTSAVDAFKDILMICDHNDCKLFLSGVSAEFRDVMSLGGVKPETNRDRAQRKLRFFPDLDAAIGKAEDMLIRLDVSFEEDSLHITSKSPGSGSGFKYALQQIDQQHKTSYAVDLVSLEEYATAFDLESGEILYEDKQLPERGLFFIEHGILKIERSSEATMSRAGNDVFNLSAQSNGTLNSLNARTNSVGIKAGDTDAPNAPRFRVARVGPGWILGSIEALGGYVADGNIIAVTQCRLHYIAYSSIRAIEEKDPLIILKLYKLLSYLMAKRQEITISQLGTLHSIMSAPARKKPISRSNSGTALNNPSSLM